MIDLVRTHRKLVTVITEANLERDLVKEIEAHGVGGYTITDARGRGDRGLRASRWDHSSNIRVEIACDTPLAEKLLVRLREKYCEHYAIVIWLQDIEVLRPAKFP